MFGVHWLNRPPSLLTLTKPCARWDIWYGAVANFFFFLNGLNTCTLGFSWVYTDSCRLGTDLQACYSARFNCFPSRKSSFVDTKCYAKLLKLHRELRIFAMHYFFVNSKPGKYFGINMVILRKCDWIQVDSPVFSSSCLILTFTLNTVLLVGSVLVRLTFSLGHC